MISNDNHFQKNVRGHYETPQLREWGVVSDLTQAGKSNPADDFHGGSVNPPGHENNPGLGNGNGPGNGQGNGPF